MLVGKECQPCSFPYNIVETSLISLAHNPREGTLQLKIREGWLDSLRSEILVGKDILGFFKNTDLDNS